MNPHCVNIGHQSHILGYFRKIKYSYIFRLLVIPEWTEGCRLHRSLCMFVKQARSLGILSEGAKISSTI